MMYKTSERLNNTEELEQRKIGKLSILVVDDEEYISRLLCELLKQKGHSCESALNGEKALELIGKKPCDVIITDVKMPQMDGFELLKRIKSSHPHIAVVVMTAFGYEYSVREALSLGAEEYLTKPFHADDVLNVIELAYLRNKAKRGKPQSADN